MININALGAHQTLCLTESLVLDPESFRTPTSFSLQNILCLIALTHEI